MRGLRRRCPRCGEGRLFVGFMRVRERCSSCSLQLAPRPGDTWGFWVLGDRIFIFVPVVLIYMGVTPTGLYWRGFFLAAVLIPLVATMPHRMGVCIGLDFLSRERWGDPSLDAPSAGARPEGEAGEDRR